MNNSYLKTNSSNNYFNFMYYLHLFLETIKTTLKSMGLDPNMALYYMEMFQRQHNDMHIFQKMFFQNILK